MLRDARISPPSLAGGSTWLFLVAVHLGAVPEAVRGNAVFGLGSGKYLLLAVLLLRLGMLYDIRYYLFDRKVILSAQEYPTFGPHKHRPFQDLALYHPTGTFPDYQRRSSKPGRGSVHSLYRPRLSEGGGGSRRSGRLVRPSILPIGVTEVSGLR